MDAQKQNLAGAAPENPNPSTDTGKATPETIVIDQATKDRLADIRARDAAQVQEALGLNSIEPDIERKRQKLDDEKEEAKRAAILILAIMRCGAIPPGYQNGGEAIMGRWQAIAVDPESTSRESTKPHGCPVKAV